MSLFSKTLANEWQGNTVNFRFHNNDSIQLNATVGGKSFISKTSSRQLNTQWEISVKLMFNPSSSNYVDIFLCTDNDSLTEASNAYFVRVGYSSDNICLYRKTANRSTKLIDGIAKRLDLPAVDVQLYVACSLKGEWQLFSRLYGEEDFVNEGETSDYFPVKSAYAGILCTYTVTRAKLFYFSDIHISIMDEHIENNLNALSSPVPLDLVINEIMFNGDEYVEIYNRSAKHIDLSQTYFAIRKNDGTISQKYPLASYPQGIEPNDFLVITKNVNQVCAHYQCNEQAHYVEAAIPALNNVGANLTLLSADDKIIDEFAYSDKMHQQLIFNKKGIALERIHPNLPSQQLDNWQSASADCGYGTPGYPNSQAYIADTVDDIWLAEDVFHFSGLNPFLYYRFSENGQLLTINIYDANGRRIKNIANNLLAGTTGSFDWDGIDEHGNNCTTGIYIANIEYVNLNGKTGKFRRVFTIGMN
jgi:hypothetical protein